MCHRYALRERGKVDFVMKGSEFPSYNAAHEAAEKEVRNSGFDAFQIWELNDTFEETVVYVNSKSS